MSLQYDSSSNVVGKQRLLSHCGNGDFCVTEELSENYNDVTAGDNSCPCYGGTAYCPPKVPLADKINLARALEKTEQYELSVNEFERRVETLKENLVRVRVEVDFLSVEQASLQVAIDECDVDDEERRNIISSKKIEKHNQLITFINTEDSLFNELEVTRQMLSSLNIDQQTFGLEMNDKIDEIYQMYTQRQDYDYNRRIEREKTISHNANIVRKREMLACRKAVEKYCLEKEAAVKAAQKPKLSPVAIANLRRFHKKTLHRISNEKWMSASAEEARQARQMRNLMTLKRELDEQKEVLMASNQLRKERALKEESDLMRRRDDILGAGENPFTLERLEEKERLQRLHEQKRHAIEYQALQQLEAEFFQEKKLERNRGKIRAELDKIWADKVKQKRRLARRHDRRFYEAYNEENKFKEGGQDVFNFDLIASENQIQSSYPQKEGRSNLDKEETQWEGTQKLNLQNELIQNASTAFKVVPESILFKDFDFGKTYRKKVTVSNRTNQRLRFYLRQFRDLSQGETQNEDVEGVKEILPNSYQRIPITEVVKVVFDAPPPLLPGLSHDFFLLFSPKTLDDWEGELHFDSVAGSFMIPIKCFQKRFAPSLSTGIVTFSNVIGGTTASAEVKVKNHGSLPGTIIQPFVMDKRSFKVPAVQMEELPPPPTPRRSCRNLSENEGSRHYVSLSEIEGNECASTSAIYLSIGGSIKRCMLNRPMREYRTFENSTGGLGLSLCTSRMTVQLEEEEGNVVIPATKPEITVEKTAEADLPIVAKVDETFTVNIKQSTNRLPGNEEVTLMVNYKPEVIGEHKLTYEIKFDDPDVSPLKLHLEGNSIENPFKVDPLNINMKICFMNMSYQQPIEIRNMSKGSGIIIPKVPSILKPFVDVTPKKLRSFPESTSLFTVKFRPRLVMLEESKKIKQFFDSDESKILDFPISFVFDGFPFEIPGPVTCTFQAILDNPELEVTPAVIDFGISSTAETLRTKVSLRNTAVAPQQFGFVEMPDWIAVQPNYGFGTLLSSESREVDILVSPPPNMVGKQQLTLKLRTFTKEYSIVVKGIAKIPMTALSHSQISFPVTCIGSSSSAVTEVYIKGTQSKKRNFQSQRGNDNVSGSLKVGPTTRFEFLVDEKYQIQITPSIGTIEPGKGQKVLVTFAPDLSYDEVKAHFRLLLQEKFEENRQNIQVELTGIYELLATASLSTASENSRSRPNGEKTKLTKFKEKRDSNLTKNPTTKEQQKKSKASIKSGHRSSRTSQTQVVVRNFDDLQLIFSDGKVVPPTNELRELKLRKDFLTRALEGTLNPSELSNPTDMDFKKTRRHLMQNFPTGSSTYTVPCHLTLPDGKEELLLLTLKCPTQKPDIILLEDSAVVNFGSTPLKTSVIKELNFFNAGIGVVDLKMETVNPYGPFIRINALRRLSPNMVFTLRLKFTPWKKEKWEEVVTIFGGESQIPITLKGEGFSSSSAEHSKKL